MFLVNYFIPYATGIIFSFGKCIHNCSTLLNIVFILLAKTI